MPDMFEIRGGAGPFEAAAVMAAVLTLLEEQEAAAAEPTRRLSPGAWVMAGRPRPVLSVRSEFPTLPGFGADTEEGPIEEG